MLTKNPIHWLLLTSVVVVATNLAFITVAPAQLVRKTGTDSFATATTVIDAPVTLPGNNTQATKELGEPNHGGNKGGKSMWWKLIVPATGTYTINTEGSDFDTTIGIYTGNSVDNLSELVSNDDFRSAGHSRVTISATVGDVIYIAVDGHDGASGTITLNISAPFRFSVRGSPTPFDLLLPRETPSETQPLAPLLRDDLPPTLFDWENSVDPDGGPVTYNLILHKESSIAFFRSGLTTSSFTIPNPLELFDSGGNLDGIPWRWTVEAVDADGNVTNATSTRFFRMRPPFNGFGVPRIVTGLVQSDLAAVRIVGATIAANLSKTTSIFNEIYVQQSESDGTYNIQIELLFSAPTKSLETEEIQITASAPGYLRTSLEILGDPDLVNLVNNVDIMLRGNEVLTIINAILILLDED